MYWMEENPAVSESTEELVEEEWGGKYFPYHWVPRAA
jgi:hypothetical protein